MAAIHITSSRKGAIKLYEEINNTEVGVEYGEICYILNDGFKVHFTKDVKNHIKHYNGKYEDGDFMYYII